MFKIVEKANHLAVHGIFDNLERAQLHITVLIAEYVRRGYFMDKTLTYSDFEVIPDA